MSYLDFIDDETLIRATQRIVGSAPEAGAVDINKNQLDPFGALFECAIGKMDFETWTKKEESRQIQKSLQNAIGDFHQILIGGLPGCEDVPRGEGLDTLNVEKAWCAEIKNKYNTTKGNHKPRLYDDIATWVDRYSSDYRKPFTGYYVQIIPSKPIDLNKPFCPPDAGVKRPHREDIREISGALFYDMITEKKGALKELFSALPAVLEHEFDIEINFDVNDLIQIFRSSIKS